MGASTLVHKPTALATDRLYELGGELVAKVIAAGRARAVIGTPPASRPRVPRRVRPARAGGRCPPGRDRDLDGRAAGADAVC